MFGLRLVAALILYLFLGLAFFAIWRDLQRAAAQPLPQPAYCLRVLAATGNSGLAAGAVLPLQPVTSLGRSAENTITLTDDAASARHARLSRDNGVWWLEDLGSKNGTLLNDLPLSKPATLAQGDVIGIGSLRLKFETDTTD